MKGAILHLLDVADALQLSQTRTGKWTRGGADSVQELQALQLNMQETESRCRCKPVQRRTKFGGDGLLESVLVC